MLRSAFAILILPSAGVADDLSRSRSSKPGNAAKHLMTHMSIYALAYIATQVRSCSEETFTAGGHEQFNYAVFYTIVKTLRLPSFQSRVRKLLHWYDQRLLPVEFQMMRGTKATGTAAVFEAQMLTEITNRERAT